MESLFLMIVYQFAIIIDSNVPMSCYILARRVYEWRLKRVCEGEQMLEPGFMNQYHRKIGKGLSAVPDVPKAVTSIDGAEASQVLSNILLMLSN
jgi:hypothetical protein